MDLKSVSCGNCGAPLQVPGAVRFLNCNHCGSSLEIKHTNSVTYCEMISQIDERTERIEQKLEIMELERELEQLDQRWQTTRERLMVSDKNGHKKVPTTGSAMVGATVSTIFGLVFMGGGLSSGE
jgi:DNA-directed RNA polymerase subunit RPC12/RpoP